MGTKFSIKDPNPGTWFKFDEKDFDSGRICIRILNEAKRQEIRKEAVKINSEMAFHPKTHAAQRVLSETIDQDKFSDMLWDYCIVSWEKLEDDEGNPIACTPENKSKLMRENIGFAQFVGSCIDILNREYEERSKSVEKNS